MPSLDVVIVNWNTRQQLLSGLEALAQPAPGSPVGTVVVVDNASTDGSAQDVRARHASLQVIANSTNVGYGAAVNQGMAATTSRFVWVANADVVSSPDTLAALADFLEAHPTVALVAPRLRHADGTVQLSWGREPHLGTEFLQRWWWRRLEAEPGQPKLARHTVTARRVDWVLGAAFLIRRAAFDALKGFDPSYFMYFEEVDFCSRARRAGWEIWYVPTADAIHAGRASTGQIPHDMAVAYRRSQLKYYRQFHGPIAAGLLGWYLKAKLSKTQEGRAVLHALAEQPA